MFGTLLDRIKHDAISLLSRLQVRTEAEVEAQERERQEQMARRLQAQHAAPQSVIAGDALPIDNEGDGGGSPILPGPHAEPAAPLVRDGRKVGRNELCPCGSGRKFKHCHGQLAREA
jgi:preprotein translocase subunit SecA